MTVRALVFDVDGTLSDTEETHRRAFNAAFMAFRLPYVWQRADYEELLKVSGGKERLSHFFGTIAATHAERARLAELVPALHRAKTECFARLVAAGGALLRPGIARLFAEAEAARVSLAIASTTRWDCIAALLNAELGTKWEQRFATIACGDMVAAKKPAPDVYRLALSRLGVEADDAIAFEDSENGLRAAKAAGLFTIVTPTRWTQRENFEAADLVVPHLGDVVQPLYDDMAARVGGALLTIETLVAIKERRTRTGMATR
jgi:beta-phosphoglucomutase-like phosphatase (HAD superfamily)